MVYVSISDKKKFKWHETVWWLFKRFLRTAVPQVPAMVMWLSNFGPKYAVPAHIIGGFLTVIDKVFRDYGLYKEFTKRL